MARRHRSPTAERPPAPVAPATGGSVVWCAVLAATAVLPFFQGGAWQGTDDLARRAVWQLTAFVAAAAAIFRAGRSGPGFQPWWSPEMSLLAALAGLGAASLQWATDPRLGLLTLLHGGACLLVVWLLVPLLRSPGRPAALRALLAATGLGVAAIGLLDVYGPAPLYPQTASPASTLGNRNYAAAVVVLTLPAAAGFLAAIRTGPRWAAAGALGLGAGYLLHTGSRAAGLAAAVQLATLGLLAMRGGGLPAGMAGACRRAAPAAIGAVVLALLIGLTDARGWRGHLGLARAAAETHTSAPNPAVPGVSAASSGLRLDSGVTDRLKVYRNTLDLVASRPILGTGLGNWGVHFPETAARHPSLFADPFRRWSRAHNDWLQTWAELGAGFLVVLAGGGVLIARRWWPWLRGRADSPADDPGWPLAMAALAGLAANMAVDFPVSNTLPPIFGAAWLALLLHARGPGRGGRAAGGRPWTRLAPWAAAGCAVLAVFAAVHYHAETAAARARLEMVRRQQAGPDDPRGLAAAARAVGSHRPVDPEWRLVLGESLLRQAERLPPGHPDAATLAEAAAGELESYLRRRPGTAFGHYLLGMARTARGDPAGAAKAFDAALRIIPDHAPSLRGRAGARLALGAGAAAADDLLALWRTDPRGADDTRDVLVQLLLEAGRGADTVPVLEEWAARSDAPLEARRVLGLVLALHTPRRADGLALLRAVLAEAGPDDLPERAAIERLVGTAPPAPPP